MKRTNFKKKVIGYIRVSTIDQDTNKNEAAILKFANDKDFGKVSFISEKISGMKSWKTRQLFEVVNDLKSGDILIVPELSRLGRSMLDVLDVLNALTNKEVEVYSVKENFQINGIDLTSKVMRTMLGLFSEVERDLISYRTKEGIAAARAKGKILGRPRGKGKSKLDKFKPQIEKLIKEGSTYSFISKRYGCSPATFTHWIKQNEITIKPQP